MSEFFQGSGEWNEPGNQSTFTEVAKEPAKEHVKGDNQITFGAEATVPSAETGGHDQLRRRPEDAIKNAPDTHSAGHGKKAAVPKKANPFV